jgi:ankyrin repeat protein
MGDADAVAQLIRQGADVNARSPHRETPLQTVIQERGRRDEIDDQLRSRDLEKMRLLLDAGADFRTHGENGSTLLHLAAGRDRDDECRNERPPDSGRPCVVQ